MSRLWSIIRSYAVICRFEYVPGELPAIAMVLFLALPNLEAILSPLIVEGLIVFVLLYFSGFIINAYTDRHTDSCYDNFKSGIPKAVDEIGLGGVRAIMFAHIALSLAITAHISYLMADLIPMLIMVGGTFFGLGYSMRPFRFKERGIWHAIALGASAFFVPFIFLIYIVVGTVPPLLFLLITGFSMVHYAMEFGNQAIDYMEDVREGIMTPPVRWGMQRSLAIAIWMFVIGFALEMAMIYPLLQARVASGGILPILTTENMLIVSFIILAIGYYIPLSGLVRMYRLSRTHEVHDYIPRFKKICKYARWQASGILGLMFVAAILFFGGLMAPAVIQDAHHVTESGSGDAFFANPLAVDFERVGGVVYAIINVSIGASGGDLETGMVGVSVATYCMDDIVDATVIWCDGAVAEGDIWAPSIEIKAHDVDDTAVRVGLLSREEVGGNSKEIGFRSVQSENEVYIYDARVEYYRVGMVGQRDRRANVSILVHNDHGEKESGSLELEVICYTSSGIEYSREELVLNYTLYGSGSWEPVVNIDVPEVDTAEISFEVNLINQRTSQPIDQTTIE